MRRWRNWSAGPHRHPGGSGDAHGAQPPAGVCPQAGSGTGNLPGVLLHHGAGEHRLSASDPYLDAPGQDETIYSERTVRLPETYWCYEPNALAPEVNGLPALGHGWITFGCLNNFCKVSELALALWALVLRAVPKSQLLLHAPQGTGRQWVHQRLAAQGIEPVRVRLPARAGEGVF